MSLRIVFMGTPDFSIPSLDILMRSGYDIAGVITATDKMGGRGKSQLIESPVKKYAVEHGLNVLQPPNLKNPVFVEELRKLQADLQVVVAFRMLPEVVWNMPPMGTINLHGSLLPKYRGAAPINWAIINGEKETGVTTFLLKHQIDTGDILIQRKIPILPDDTAGTLHDRMMLVGAQVVLESVLELENHSLSPTPQIDSKATPAPKITRETCEIDFDRPVNEVYNFVRGLSPYPTAWTHLDGKLLKVFGASVEQCDHESAPGDVVTDSKDFLAFACQDGYLYATEVQLEGKRRMGIREFLNGYAPG